MIPSFEPTIVRSLTNEEASNPSSSTASVSPTIEPRYEPSIKVNPSTLAGTPTKDHLNDIYNNHDYSPGSHPTFNGLLGESSHLRSKRKSRLRSSGISIHTSAEPKLSRVVDLSEPSEKPSAFPSSQPTIPPSWNLSPQPTIKRKEPTSEIPSHIPSYYPTIDRPPLPRSPSLKPTVYPSAQPSNKSRISIKADIIAFLQIKYKLNNVTDYPKFCDIMTSYTPFLISQLWEPNRTVRYQKLSDSKIQVNCDVDNQKGTNLGSINYSMEYISRHKNVIDFHKKFKSYTNAYNTSVLLDLNEVGINATAFYSTHLAAEYTPEPTSFPSTVPSQSPSVNPSLSFNPSASPSVVSSTSPSNDPSTLPSEKPSSIPSIIPSALPSSKPSPIPSSIPSLQPST